MFEFSKFQPHLTTYKYVLLHLSLHPKKKKKIKKIDGRKVLPLKNYDTEFVQVIEMVLLSLTPCKLPKNIIDLIE